MTRSRNSAPAPPKEPTPDLLPIHRTLLSEIRRSTRINTEAGPKEITIEEAVILQLIQTAVKKGSSHALGQLIRIAQKAQKQEAKRIAEEIAWGRERQERAFRELNHWTAVGRDPKMFFLHPDDIVITEGVGCDIIGPIDQEDFTEVLKRREERDALFVQATLEERLASKQEWIEAGENTQKKPGAMAWFMMHMIDSTLPVRFRLTALDLIRFDRIYNTYDQARAAQAHRRCLAKAWQTHTPRPTPDRAP